MENNAQCGGSLRSQQPGEVLPMPVAACTTDAAASTHEGLVAADYREALRRRLLLSCGSRSVSSGSAGSRAADFVFQARSSNLWRSSAKFIASKHSEARAIIHHSRGTSSSYVKTPASFSDHPAAAAAAPAAAAFTPAALVETRPPQRVPAAILLQRLRQKQQLAQQVLLARKERQFVEQQLQEQLALSKQQQREAAIFQRMRAAAASTQAENKGATATAAESVSSQRLRFPAGLCAVHGVCSSVSRNTGKLRPNSRRKVFFSKKAADFAALFPGLILPHSFVQLVLLHRAVRAAAAGLRRRRRELLPLSPQQQQRQNEWSISSSRKKKRFSSSQCRLQRLRTELQQLQQALYCRRTRMFHELVQIFPIENYGRDRTIRGLEIPALDVLERCLTGGNSGTFDASGVSAAEGFVSNSTSVGGSALSFKLLGSSSSSTAATKFPPAVSACGRSGGTGDGVVWGAADCEALSAAVGFLVHMLAMLQKYLDLPISSRISSPSCNPSISRPLLTRLCCSSRVVGKRVLSPALQQLLEQQLQQQQGAVAEEVYDLLLAQAALLRGPSRLFRDPAVAEAAAAAATAAAAAAVSRGCSSAAAAAEATAALEVAALAAVTDAISSEGSSSGIAPTRRNKFSKSSVAAAAGSLAAERSFNAKLQLPLYLLPAGGTAGGGGNGLVMSSNSSSMLLQQQQFVEGLLSLASALELEWMVQLGGGAFLQRSIARRRQQLHTAAAASIYPQYSAAAANLLEDVEGILHREMWGFETVG